MAKYVVILGVVLSGCASMQPEGSVDMKHNSSDNSSASSEQGEEYRDVLAGGHPEWPELPNLDQSQVDRTPQQQPYADFLVGGHPDWPVLPDLQKHRSNNNDPAHNGQQDDKP